MPPMSLASMIRRRAVAAWLALVALGLVAVPPGSAAPAARPHAATTCDVKRDGRKLGATYVRSLKATGVSCPKAKRVVKAFNACRKAHGGADGTCTTPVQSFRCAERRGAAIPTQYSSRVTCKSGARLVRFAYTQFT
jgi:hypothetical protein